MLEELQQELSDNNFQICDFKTSIENNVFDIVEAIADKFEPNYSYNKNQCSIELSFKLHIKKHFNNWYEIFYKFTFVSNELRMSKKVLQDLKSSNYKYNLEKSKEFENHITAIESEISNLNELTVINLFKDLKKNQNTLNKLLSKNKKLNNQITTLEKQSDFKVLDKILVPIEFNVDKFLCEHYYIKYDGVPNNQQIKLLKEAIKKSGDKSFDFLCKEQSLNKIKFINRRLIVKDNGSFYVSGLKSRSKKAINDCLSNQFVYNGRVATVSSFDKSELFYKLFPNKRDVNSKHFHYYYTGYGLTIDINEIKSKLGKEALQKDLMTF